MTNGSDGRLSLAKAVADELRERERGLLNQLLANRLSHETRPLLASGSSFLSARRSLVSSGRRYAAAQEVIDSFYPASCSFLSSPASPMCPQLRSEATFSSPFQLLSFLFSGILFIRLFLIKPSPFAGRRSSSGCRRMPMQLSSAW